MRGFPLEVFDGHLVLTVDGARALIDTGSPRSVGPQGRWAFLGQTYALEPSYLSVTAELLTESVGTPLDMLIGADVLGGLAFCVDVRRSVMEFSRGLDAQPPGAELALTFEQGVPMTPVHIDGEAVRGCVDTGAKLSYLARERALHFPHLREERDFYPGYGHFTAQVHAVPVELGGIPLTLACGILPEELEPNLLATGPECIVGTDVFRDHHAWFLMPEGLLVLRAFDPASVQTRP